MRVGGLGKVARAGEDMLAGQEMLFQPKNLGTSKGGDGQSELLAALTNGHA